MTTLRPARVRGNWAGDYKVLEPGRYAGEEILKPYCIYVMQELAEISNHIADKSGQDPETIIEVLGGSDVK